MSVKLLTEQHLEFLSLKGGCTDSFESTLVKKTHCWISRVTAHIVPSFSVSCVWLMIRKPGPKLFFMLNSTEHEISSAHKTDMLKNQLSCFQTFRCEFIILINDKCLQLLAVILTLMSMINFMLSWVEYEQSYNLRTWLKYFKIIVLKGDNMLIFVLFACNIEIICCFMYILWPCKVQAPRL